MPYGSVSYFLTKTCVPVRESEIDSINDSFAISFVVLHDARMETETIASIERRTVCGLGVKLFMP